MSKLEKHCGNIDTLSDTFMHIFLEFAGHSLFVNFSIFVHFSQNPHKAL